MNRLTQYFTDTERAAIERSDSVELIGPPRKSPAPYDGSYIGQMPLTHVEPRAQSSPYCPRCRYNELWAAGVVTLAVIGMAVCTLVGLWRR
jgi:hypothetical protein